MKTVLALAFASLLALPAMAEAPGPIPGPIIVVTHVDFIPDNLDAGQPVLEQFARGSQSDPGVQSFTLITWAPTTNHFQLIEVYDSINAFYNHVQAPHTMSTS